MAEFKQLLNVAEDYTSVAEQLTGLDPDSEQAHVLKAERSELLRRIAQYMDHALIDLWNCDLESGIWTFERDRNQPTGLHITLHTIAEREEMFDPSDDDD